jgi:phosphoribosylformimino-5-aminoimidazole carboxamide ribotide isomerase
MEVVPVIDLKNGAVVRARRGDRAAYRPIETPLSPTSEPVDVIAGFLSVHPFRTLYVADLDAIEGKGDACAILDEIARAFPHLSLWIDNGCSERAAVSQLLARRPAASLVLGSESQHSRELVREWRSHPRIVLSLDFRGEHFLGPEALLQDHAAWPDRLILMSLARVGSGAGPDLERFQRIKARAGTRAIFLAGGLRGSADLAAVAESGADGILVASALHDEQLGASDLAAINHASAGSPRAE